MWTSGFGRLTRMIGLNVLKGLLCSSKVTMGVRAKKIRGGGGGRNYFAKHWQKSPDFICPKICTLDMTTCSLCVYSKGILLVCALQNQYYPFKSNKPDPIARLSSKNKKLHCKLQEKLNRFSLFAMLWDKLQCLTPLLATCLAVFTT